jgi:hypothetical protein
MKYTLSALTALVSIASMTSSPLAEAGGRGILADVPCPYGSGGDPWTATAATTSPYSPGLNTGNFASLTAGANTVINQDGFSYNSAVQYDTYAAPIPAASSCPALSNLAPNPIEQVLVYTLQSGNSANFSYAANDTEVLFNYDSSSPLIAGQNGTATFTMGGVTYTSTGSGLPVNTDNDFLFDSSGKFIGALNLDASDNLTLNTKVLAPTGWTSSGTVAPAPEIDSSLAISAFTLLAGFLAVARGGRRALRSASRV